MSKQVCKYCGKEVDVVEGKFGDSILDGYVCQDCRVLGLKKVLSSMSESELRKVREGLKEDGN